MFVTLFKIFVFLTNVKIQYFIGTRPKLKISKICLLSRKILNLRKK